MTRRILSALSVLALLTCDVASAAAPRTLRAVEEAAESPALDISLTSTTEGRVNARLCDRCDLLTLRVNADTVVLYHGAPTTLEVAKDRAAQGATVFFDRESLIVRRIVLWDQA